MNYTHSDKSNLLTSIFKNSGIKAVKITFMLLLPLFLLSSFQTNKPILAKPEPLRLRTESIFFTPQEFYIADVVDARKERKAVAFLQIPSNTPAQPSALQPVDFEGGGLTAVKQFINKGLPRNTQLRPIIVRLKTCEVNETMVGKDRVEGKITVAMDFAIQGNGKTLHTLEYKGGGRYLRPLRDLGITEPTLRRSLTDALVYLNTWMNREADKSEKLATAVKIIFKDYSLNHDPDTVFYSPNRPLTWNDFRAQPQPGQYAAAVLPGFAFTGDKEIHNGIIYLTILVKVYMVRDGSWVRAGTKDAFGLNHEQRHFDLVKIVAERFKKTLSDQKLTVEDYSNTISAQYFETLREISRVQKQYDDESRHGLDVVAQQRWNSQIEEELQSFITKK